MIFGIDDKIIKEALMKGILVEVNGKFIPNIGEDENGIFQLLLLFDCNND